MKTILLFFILCANTKVYAQYFNLQFPVSSEPAIFGPVLFQMDCPTAIWRFPLPMMNCFIPCNMAPNLMLSYIAKSKELMVKPGYSMVLREIWRPGAGIFPDGKRLYFTSNRPLTDTGKEAKDFDIWYIEKTGKSGERR